MNKNWYAVYTKTQCEKKVVAQLAKKRIESFFPVNRRIISNGNRKKLVTEPLFPSFVFVNISEAELTSVRQTSDVINFIYWLGKPAIIRAAEVENIYHFVNNYHNIELTKVPVNTSATVRITNVPKIDIKQGLVSTNVSTIRITLPSLGYVMQAEADMLPQEVSTIQAENVNLVI